MYKKRKFIILIGLFFLLVPTVTFAINDEDIAAREERPLAARRDTIEIDHARSRYVIVDGPFFRRSTDHIADA